jgi:hypothetical protein
MMALCPMCSSDKARWLRTARSTHSLEMVA